MGMKHAAVMAGLVLGLMSGAAHAAMMPITYQVDRTDVSSSVTGTITTDGTSGALTASNITSFYLNLTSKSFFGPQSSATISGNASNVSLTNKSFNLSATPSNLTFDFSGNDSTLSFFNNVGSESYALTFYSGQSGTFFRPYVEYDTRGLTTSIFKTEGTVALIGTAGSDISPVPLPASAPMFGTALLALGAVGYGVKRQKAVAATV